MVSYLKKMNQEKNINEKKRDNFYPNWAGLAMLFSRQLLKGSQDFFFVLVI